MREGGTNADIAARLGISLDAVKYHISNMLGKLELPGRHELAAWRPEHRRGPLRALSAIPAIVWSLTRPLVWIGAGAAAVAGTVVVAIVVVAVIVVARSVAGGDGERAVVVPLPPPIPVATDATLSSGPCARPTDADCIRAVYLGAPDDYAQVVDIPADVLLTPDTDGRYVVQRGQQVTVVTAALLPSGWTRFWLDRSPLEFGIPSPTSFEQLIQSAGTTYTFTVTDDERGASLITFELAAARPHPVRPTHKPELGDVVVTMRFVVPTVRYNLLDVTGAADAPGSYAFLGTPGDLTSAAGGYLLSPYEPLELRLHPTDASGTSRGALYDTIAVGDYLDYQVNGIDCGNRLQVTSVGASASPRAFGLKPLSQYGGWCPSYPADPALRVDAAFLWKAEAGLSRPDGSLEMLQGVPTGGGTYALRGFYGRLIVSVPEGYQAVLAGPVSYDSDEGSGSAIPFTDVATGSYIWLDTLGWEFNRTSSSSAVDALFDYIKASLYIAPESE